MQDNIISRLTNKREVWVQEESWLCYIPLDVFIQHIIVKVCLAQLTLYWKKKAINTLNIALESAFLLLNSVAVSEPLTFSRPLCFAFGGNEVHWPGGRAPPLSLAQLPLSSPLRGRAFAFYVLLSISGILNWLHI